MLKTGLCLIFFILLLSLPFTAGCVNAYKEMGLATIEIAKAAQVGGVDREADYYVPGRFCLTVGGFVSCIEMPGGYVRVSHRPGEPEEPISGENMGQFAASASPIAPAEIMVPLRGCYETFRCPIECSGDVPECCDVIVCPDGQGVCIDCDSCKCGSEES